MLQQPWGKGVRRDKRKSNYLFSPYLKTSAITCLDTSSSALLYLEDMFYLKIHCQLTRVLAYSVHCLAFLPIRILNSVNRKELRVNWYSDLNWVFVGEEKKEDSCSTYVYTCKFLSKKKNKLQNV